MSSIPFSTLENAAFAPLSAKALEAGMSERLESVFRTGKTGQWARRRVRLSLILSEYG
jgi:hypothetical protein